MTAGDGEPGAQTRQVMASRPRGSEPDVPEAAVPEAVDQVRAEIHQRLFGFAEARGAGPEDRSTVEKPRTLGRFEIAGEIGRGSMGVVLLARDPQLERNVALKLLPERRAASSDPQRRERLLREAKAMARLSHPNVVTVHEVGEVDGQIYVAMEYVEGSTLSAFLAQGHRPWREVVDVFRAAGRGLAAAHAAGLVHRDFKPDNVLLGPGDRVRVADFGLVQSDGGASSPGAVEDEDGEGATRPGGKFVGTPAFLAPEADGGSPRGDQYAFCVALHGALTGSHPFADRSFAKMQDRARRGDFVASAAWKGLPRRLQRIVARGLESDPSRRWPTMEALVEALDGIVARRSRAVSLGVMGALVVAASGYAAWREQESGPAAVCEVAVAAMDEVWNDAVRERLRETLARHAPGRPSPSVGSTLRLVDRYAERWKEGMGVACLEAWQDASDEAKGSASPVRLCLDLHRQGVADTIDLLASSDDAVTVHALEAVAGLGDPSACRHAVASVGHAARDAETEAMLVRARRRLVVARVEAALGHDARVVETATEIVGIARSLGSAVVEADALYVLGRAKERLGASSEANEVLRQAIARAEAAGDHLTRARALIYRIYVVGRSLGHAQEAYELAGLARSALAAIDLDPLMEADRLNNLAAVEAKTGALSRALEHHREALRIRRELLGEEHPTTLLSLGSVGSVLSESKQHVEAVETLRAAAEGAAKLLGSEHPLAVTAQGNLANAYARSGDLETAVAITQKVVALREATLGVASPQLAPTLFNLGVLLGRLGRAREAIGHLRRGLSLREATVGAQDPSLLPWLSALGTQAVAVDELGEAVAYLERALALVEARGASAEDRGQARFALARVLVEVRDGRSRALALASAAQEDLRAAGADAKTAEMAAWLKRYTDGRRPSR